MLDVTGWFRASCKLTTVAVRAANLNQEDILIQRRMQHNARISLENKKIGVEMFALSVDYRVVLA